MVIKHIKNGVKYMLLSVAGMVLALTLVMAIAVPIYINTNRHRDKLAEIIGNAVGGKASIAELDLSLRGGIKLVARGIKISNKEERLVLLRAKEVDLSLKIAPLLLRRRFEFRKIIIDTPYILLNRNAEGVWESFLTLPRKEPTENEWASIPGGEINPLLFTHRLIIKEGTIDIVDEKDTGQASMRIRDINITATPEATKDRVKVEATLNIPEDDRLIEISFNGQIKRDRQDLKESAIEGVLRTGRFSLRFLGAYLKKYPIYSRIKATGIIETDLKVNLKGEYSAAGHITHMLPLEDTLKNISKDTKTPLDLLYDLKGGKDFVQVNHIGLSGEHGSINIKGEILNLRSGNPDIAISANTSLVDINWLKENLYSEILPEKLVNTVKTHLSGGRGIVEEISFKGSWENLKEINKPDTLKRVEGKIRLEGISIINLGKYKNLESVSGRLSLGNGNLSYENIDLTYSGCSLYGTSGSIENVVSYPKIDMKLSTELSLKGDTPCQIFNINEDNILTWLGGTIGINSAIKGGLSEKESLAANGELNLSAASYTYGQLFRKEAGTSNVATYNLKSGNNRLNINSASIQVNDSKLSLSGGIDLSKGGGFRLNIKSNDIKTDDFAAILHQMEKGGKGIIRLKGDISGRNNSIANIGIKGDILLYKVGFKIKNSLKEVSNLNANIEAINKDIFFREASWFFGPDMVNASGKYSWIGKKKLQLTLNSRNLNIDYLFPKDKTETKNDKPGTDIAGNISAGRGSYKGLPFENLRIGINSTDKRFIAKPFYCNGFNGGSISGNWQVGDEGIEINITARDVDVNDVGQKLSLNGLKEINGKGTISVSLKGKGNNAKARKETMDGDASLLLRNGSIHRLSVLSRIFSLLNLSKVIRFEAPDLQTKGMSYHSITSTFDFSDGIGSTKDFLLDSDSLRMSGVGDINLKDNSLDMIIGVQPFQLIDSALSSLSLVGKVLTGERGAFIVHYYSVTGPLNDLQIKGMPLETVNRLVSNAIMGLINLPETIAKDLKSLQPQKPKGGEGKKEPLTDTELNSK
ncbi:MAG: AsmA-like C-terminal domain-containing protein [Nitrospinae bacterium]|nr:AsmA-like C-terminal domain-containing protein [Nitrospinota bacterium]